MISIRKYIEDYKAEKRDRAALGTAVAETAAPGTVAELTPGRAVPEPTAAEFRAMLLAIGECTGRAVPNLGIDITQNITAIEKSFVSPVTNEHLSQTGQQTRTELAQWADRASARHQEIQRELREIVAALSGAAETICRRDEKYTKEIGVLTLRLGAIAEENDLTRLRESLVDCTKSIKSCVARMAEESKAAVHHLTSQVKEYRTKLDEAERELMTDPLTRLSNRRAFERHIEACVAEGKPFSLLMIDLNDFKSVNDSYGHVAGDDLLKQFGTEIRSQFTSGEMVSRLGGDEFIVVIAGGIFEANEKADRIHKWVLGEYKIDTGDRTVRIDLRASIGAAEWDGAENAMSLVARVDREVYKAKRSAGRTRNPSISSERRSSVPAAPENQDFSHVIR